jgi:hypothetical protein
MRLRLLDADRREQSFVTNTKNGHSLGARFWFGVDVDDRRSDNVHPTQPPTTN